MAALPLPAPGTEYGPCAEPCQHKDCASTRAMSEVICPDCREPIGYDRPFYRDNAEGETDWSKLVHEGCYLRRMAGRNP